MNPIAEMFRLGMKRELPEFKSWFGLLNQVNVGCGTHYMDGAINLDKNPARDDIIMYDADTDAMPLSYDTYDVIHCYHLLEHLTNPLFFLRECQSVLRVGGLLNICVPHYQSEIAWSDLTHVRGIALSTFEMLLRNDNYKRTTDWRFKLNGAIAIGIQDRNLSILAQLEKQ